jgi:hypothetical protein
MSICQLIYNRAEITVAEITVAFCTCKLRFYKCSGSASVINYSTLEISEITVNLICTDL